MLQIPIGKIIDSKKDEKVFLLWGFIIMCLSMITISFMGDVSNFWIWAIILFSTRIGAAIIEITTESLFFKRVDSSDTDMIGIFRMAHPMAFAILSLFAGMFLFSLPTSYVFGLFGVIILFVGLRYTLDIRQR